MTALRRAALPVVEGELPPLECPARVEHPIAVTAPSHEGVAQQGQQQLQTVALEVFTCDRQRALERERAREHRQALEEPGLVPVELVVTPLDRGTQRPLPV